MTTKTRALLIDGTGFFIRSYVVNSTSDVNGNPVGGISGTLKSLRSIIRTLKPDKVIYVWDGPGGSTKRRALFKEYKQGRRPKTIVGRNYVFGSVEEAERNKAWQIQKLKELMDYLPICQVEIENVEADDVIAYIANSSNYFGYTSNIIVTCDQDFYQLIGPKTVIYNPIKKKLVTTETLLESTGYHSNNWLFFKAINGDKSDNIGGVKGFGPKTIAKLFEVHEPEELTPDIIKKNLEIAKEIGNEFREKKYQKLYDNLGLIERNWKLMSLKDVLMSINAKDQLTQKILNFVPTLNKSKFYVELMNMGGLSIPTSYFNEFNTLKRRL